MRATAFLSSCFVVAALGAVACSPASNSGAETETQDIAPMPADNPTPPVPDAAAINAALPEVGETYWAARQQLLAAGFTPVDVNDWEFTACPTAHEEQRFIAVEDCPSEVIVMPEVADCAGTGLGQCLTNWQTPDHRFLSIVTVDGPQPGVIQSIEWLDARPPSEDDA